MFDIIIKYNFQQPYKSQTSRHLELQKYLT